MTRKTPPKERTEDYYRQRRTRRLSIFLILGVAALLAVSTWAASSWYSSHFGSSKQLENLPPPPALEGAPATK